MNIYESCASNDSGKEFFWNLWQKNSRSLYRKCLGMMNWDRDDAEDALSTAMVHAYEKHRGFCGQIENYKAWFFKVTHNVCIDIIRKKKGYHAVNLESGIVGWDEMSYEIGEFSPSAEEVADTNEMVKGICREIRVLPDKLKKPVLMKVFTDMDSDEISANLNISNPNLRKRLQLARNFISEGIRQDYSELKGGLNLKWGIEEFEEIREEGLAVSLSNSREIMGDQRLVRILEWESGLKLTPAGKPVSEKIKPLKDYISRYPGGWKKRLVLGELYFEERELDQAVFELQNVIRRSQLSVKAYSLMGDILRILGRKSEAIEAYTQAQRVVQRESSKSYFEGLIKFLQKKYLEALEHFKTAIFSEPDNQVFYNSAAEAALKLGDKYLAEKMLLKTLKIDSEDMNAVFILYILALLKKDNLSIRRYQHLIREKLDMDTFIKFSSIALNEGFLGIRGRKKIS